MEVYNNMNQANNYVYNNCEPMHSIYDGCYPQMSNQMMNVCTTSMPMADNNYLNHNMSPQPISTCTQYGPILSNGQYQYVMATHNATPPMLMSSSNSIMCSPLLSSAQPQQQQHQLQQQPQSHAQQIAQQQSVQPLALPLPLQISSDMRVQFDGSYESNSSETNYDQSNNLDALREMHENNSNVHMCTVCFADFNSVEEVLRHELIFHSQDSHRSIRPMRHIVNAVARAFNSSSQQQLRSQVYFVLGSCPPQNALSALLSCYAIEYAQLFENFTMVEASLQQMLSAIGNFSIHLFGSYANLLCLRDSDLDFFIQEHPLSVRTQQRTMHAYNRIYKAMRAHPAFSEVIFIRSARVPIIRAVHVKTTCSVDLNLSNNNCLHNSNFVRDVMLFDDRIRDMALFLKIWAKQNQIIGRGHMSSYCFVTLIIFFLQSTNEQYEQILPSIQKLQQNVDPLMDNWINYAYHLHGRMAPLPPNITATTLIKGFYRFYHNYDFSKLIVAPHLGRPLPITTFKDPEFVYVDYRQQMTLQNAFAYTGAPPKLEIDHCIVVQDIFCLTYNLARSVNESLLEFFTLCTKQAYQFCNTFNLNETELYKKLLYDTGNRLSISRPPTGAFLTGCQPFEISYIFQRSNSETRALTAWLGGFPTEKSIHSLWSKCYVEIIYDLLTKIYLVDIEPNSSDIEPNYNPTPYLDNTNPNNNNNHNQSQQMATADGDCTEIVWYLSGRVDLWTGRILTRHRSYTFMGYHLRQTKEMLKERSDKQFYIYPFRAKLTLRIKGENHSIQMSLIRQPAKLITKKDRIRKLFSTLKANLQNFNFREKLEEYAESQQIVEMQYPKQLTKKPNKSKMAARRSCTNTAINNNVNVATIEDLGYVDNNQLQMGNNQTADKCLQANVNYDLIDQQSNIENYNNNGNCG